MKVEKFEIEKSIPNPQQFILIATTEDGKKYVVSGDSYNPTYLVPYENAFDTPKPMRDYVEYAKNKLKEKEGK